MNIIQSKFKKIIASLITIVMMIGMTMPIFAATYTNSINVGDSLKFSGNSWTIYKSKTSAENLDKSKVAGTIKKDETVTVKSKSGNVLQIGTGKYIYYGSTASKNFSVVKKATTVTPKKEEPKNSNVTKKESSTKVNTEAVGGIVSGVATLVTSLISSIISIVKGLIANRNTTPITTNQSELSKEEITIKVGNTGTIYFTFNETKIDTSKLDIKTSDSKIAVVTTSGTNINITGKTVGKPTITVSYKYLGKTYSNTCKVTVTANTTNKLTTNESIVYNFLKANNFNNAGIAGIMGNMYIESRFTNLAKKTKDINGKYAKGLCQWNEAGGFTMEEIPNDIQGQCKFFIKTFSRKASYPNGEAMLTKLKGGFSNSEQGARDAANYFRANYENTSYGKDSRKNRAAYYYNIIK